MYKHMGHFFRGRGWGEPSSSGKNWHTEETAPVSTVICPRIGFVASTVRGVQPPLPAHMPMHQ